jgi:putative solute:sodium symporter small subunit
MQENEALDAARVRRLLAARAAHWQRNRRVTGILLALWLATTFCSVFFARDLASFSVFGWPLSFYLAAQGASLIYLAVIGCYALAMARIDRRFAHELAQGEVP